MKVFKKIATVVCGAMALTCLAIGGFSFKTDVAEAGSKGENYLVGGASVRLVNDAHGPGVKFHVWLTLDEFDRYGSISGDTLTLDAGYTTGTLVLPYNVLNGDDLVYGYTAANGAKAHCEYTTKLWHKVEIDHVEYAESIVYMHNIPASQYGTEMAVRGVIFKDGQPLRYTQQENGISMSYVADAEYNDENTKLNGEQLEALRNEYIKKDVTIVVNGETKTLSIDYLSDIGEDILPKKQADGDELVGLYTAAGKEVSVADGIKNHTTVYARYRESIVLTSATPSYDLGAYKLNADDVVKSMIFTAKDGSTYDLGTNPDNVSAGAGYASLKTTYSDHGEGTVTAVLNDGSADYTLTLPALVVTEELTTANFNTVINYNDSIYYNASSKSLYGYFRLTEDVTLKSFTVPGYANVNSKGPYGFRGTFDGMGHTISGGWTDGGGVFGTIGTGALVKNVNFSVPYLHNGSCAVWALHIYQATLENITVTSTKVSNYVAGDEPGNYMGYLAVQGAQGSTFRNITVNASGSIKTLFGSNAQLAHDLTNVFENFQINATSVDYLGTGKKDGVKYHYTIADAIEAGAEIILNGAGLVQENITLGERSFVFNGETASKKFSLDLGSHDDGYKVESITFGAFDLGTDEKNLDVSDLRADVQSHGKGNIVVELEDRGNRKTIIVPTVFVTEEISTADRLKTIFSYDETANPYCVLYEQADTNRKAAVFGYFRLTNNITGVCATDHPNAAKILRSNKSYGFRGTIDGAGYTIKASNYPRNYGLVGSIGEGACFKDVTFEFIYQQNNYRPILGDYIQGATFEDVIFNVTSVTSYTAGSELSVTANKGMLCTNGSSGSTFKNVTLNINGSVYSIFGGYNWKEYEKSSIGPNVYDNFVINATTVDYMGIRNLNSVATGVTVQEEIDSGSGIIYNGAGLTETTVTLPERQEFMMLHTEFWVELGEYANQKIESIKMDGVDLGKDASNLDMEAFRTNYKSHGEKTLTVVCVAGSTKTTLNIPVLLISREISTESELKETLLFNTANRFYNTTDKAIYGYFRLQNNVTVSEWTLHSSNASFTHANRLQGFRATFDGASYTIKGNNPGSFGLFTSIGNGGHIKNVTFSLDGYYNSGYTTIIANYIQGATIEDVTVSTTKTSRYDASATEEAKYKQMGYLAVNGASGSTFRNVTVNANGDIYSLFGGWSWQEYEKSSIGQNTYDNFVFNGTVDYVGFRNVNSVATGVAVDEEIFTGEGIIYNGEGLMDMVSDITLEDHDIVLGGVNATNGSKQRINVGKYVVYGQNVQSITLEMENGSIYDLGTDISALSIPDALRENVSEHGLGTVTVVTQYDTVVTVPVMVITYEITKAEELNNDTTGLFMFKTSNPYFDADTNTIDGYFTLGANVAFWSTPNNSAGNTTEFNYETVTYGFVGTFDGRNYTVENTARDTVGSSGQTVTGDASTRGLFGMLGEGALVKNVVLAVNTYRHKQYATAIATAAYYATFENVTINVTTVDGYDGAMEQLVGLLTTNSIGGCTFNNVTVNLNGGHIESLFGGRGWNGYEWANLAGQNTYNNLVINGTVDYIGTGSVKVEGKDVETHYTIEEEIASGAGITYNP